MRVTCSVVSGADSTQLPAFLASLRQSVARRADLQLEVHAVVNGPDARLADAIGPLVDEVVVRDRPWGFAVNHNDVLRRTDSLFHVIANDDIVVLDDALGKLMDAIQQPGAERVAVISPVLLNPDRSLQPSTYSFPTLATAALSVTGARDRMPSWLLGGLAKAFRRKPGSSRLWEHDRVTDVDTLRGAFVVVRRSAVEEVGLMSEVALVGGEEVEWHKRMADAGWLVRLLPEAKVVHVGRVSTGGRPDLDIEYLKGTVNFFRLHANRPQFELVRVLARARARQLMRQERRAGKGSTALYPPTLREMTFAGGRR